jgi:hypothetical protein
MSWIRGIDNRTRLASRALALLFAFGAVAWQRAPQPSPCRASARANVNPGQTVVLDGVSVRFNGESHDDLDHGGFDNLASITLTHAGRTNTWMPSVVRLPQVTIMLEHCVRIVARVRGGMTVEVGPPCACGRN